jgi:hypothetical protein
MRSGRSHRSRWAAMPRPVCRPLVNCSRTGGLTVTELAGRVGLSFSPWHRRLRALEQSGAISGYHVHLDANAFGLTFEALVSPPCAPEIATPSTPSIKLSPPFPTSCRPNGSSVTPTTCCASSPATCPPTRGSTATASPHSPRRPAPQLHPRHEKCRGEPATAPMRTEGVRHLTGLVS